MIIVTAVDEDDESEVYAFDCASKSIADMLEGSLIVCGSQGDGPAAGDLDSRLRT